MVSGYIFSSALFGTVMFGLALLNNCSMLTAIGCYYLAGFSPFLGVSLAVVIEKIGHLTRQQITGI